MDFKAGELVVMDSAEKHSLNPNYYPKVGTVGEVIEIGEKVLGCGAKCIQVQWPEGSTQFPYRWWLLTTDLKTVESE